MADKLVVRGAREHNLRNISLELPRDKLIVFTGLSGSGKSSLAFDTIYAEGQRRYVESLSAYARQFLGQMDKPDVDFIEGCRPRSRSTRSPPRATRGRPSARSPRSTTTSGCSTPASACRTARTTARVITRQTPQQIVDRILELPDGTRFQVLAPVVRGRKGTYETLLADLAAQGFARARIDGEVHELTDKATRARPLRAAHHRGHRRPPGAARRHRAPAHRLARDGAAAGRGRGRGADRAARRATTSEAEILTFSQHLACPTCGTSFDELAPRNFSFNSPYGACETCDGLGTRSRSTPSSSSRTPTSPWTRAPSRRGRASARSTSRGSSTQSPRSKASTSTCRGRS